MATLSCAFLIMEKSSHADEGGVPFWLSGQFASFAAVPQPPGWYVPTMFYYYVGDASASKDFTRGTNFAVGVDTRMPMLFVIPTFVPEGKFLGGQPSFALAFGGGHNVTSADVSVSREGTRTLNFSDSVWGFTDLYPLVSLGWTHDVHNGMVYLSGDIPIGAYESRRLANVGIGHGAVDGGGGYTYLNETIGFGFSAVAGLTFNLVNGNTNYQNGLDSHLDYAITQFLSEQFHIGAVGYLYYQLTADTGSGAKLGPFKSKVASIGPELGYLFKVANRQWYANARGYWEFWAEHRVQGVAAFAMLNIPITGGKQEAASAAAPPTTHR